MTTFPNIPLGHTIPAHQAFGWCSYCPNRTPAEELAAWQTRETDETIRKPTRDQLLEAVDRVRALHHDWDADPGHCAHCQDGMGTPLPWPCPTIRALEG